MRNYVISLERTPDRLEAFRRQNASVLDFEVFAAVDGKAAPAVDPTIDDGGMSYTPGAKGAALSHIGLWRQIVASGEAGTIFEDDAVVNKDFFRHQTRLLKPLGKTWDLVMWGYNFDSLLNVDMGAGLGDASILFDEAKMREGVKSFASSEIAPSLLKLRAAFGIMSYSVSVRGAQTLLERMLPIRAGLVHIPGIDSYMKNFGIDVLLNGYYAVMNAYAAFPPIAVSLNDKTISTVGGVETLQYPQLKVASNPPPKTG